MPATSAVLQTSISGVPVRRGKVRDVYDLGETLLLVATDRISAFDWVLPTGIPDKGRVLTQLSEFWFDELAEPNHVLVDRRRPHDGAASRQPIASLLAGRSDPGRCKTQVVPIECVVHAAIWPGPAGKNIGNRGTVCGIQALPAGLDEYFSNCPSPSSRPPRRRKAATTSTFRSSEWCDIDSRRRSWPKSCAPAASASISGAAEMARRDAEASSSPTRSSKWGQFQDDSLILIDEVLTPDSSLDLAGRRLSSLVRQFRRRSTSSSFVTGSRPQTGIKTARRRSCPTMSSRALPCQEVHRGCTSCSRDAAFPGDSRRGDSFCRDPVAMQLGQLRFAAVRPVLACAR